MDSNSSSHFLAQYPVQLNLAPTTQQNSIAPNNTRSRTSPSLDSNDMAPPNSATDDKKRLTACLVCRKRKLKCDSARPKCASCARLGHACGYEETRKKSGPKQGYVKKLEQKSQTLEQRLAQLEKLLATHQSQQSASPSSGPPLPTPPGISPLPFENLSTPGSATTNAFNQFPTFSPNDTGGLNPNVFTTQPMFPDLTPPENNIDLNTFPLFAHDANADQSTGQVPPSSDPLLGSWAWDMVSLGIQEELPPEEITNRLTEIYFEKAHAMLPFLHRSRFMASLQLPPNIGAPVCLRYAVWALGAATSHDQNLRSYKDVFYSRARRSLTETLETTLDSLKAHRITTLQTLVLLTTYEFLHANFGHAWMNCGKAARMSVYFNLMRLDEPHLFCKQTLQEERDWIDHEERRRTFWAAFMLDRFASLGTGWASTFNEEDITTALPGPDDEYQAGIGTLGETTGESIYPSTKNSASRKKIGAMGAVVRVTAFLGRLNVHVNRPNQDKDYLARHRDLDNLLATIQFSIPQNLAYMPGSLDMQSAFLQNLLSVSTVLLNQAALYKSQLTELPLRLSDLASRCHMGALQIANTVRGTSNVHVTRQCPYTAFCIYVGARVFVEMLRQPAPTTPPSTGPTREDLQGDLNMLLAALQSFTDHIPLAGHFLMQLQADLNGLDNVISQRPYDVTVGYGECHVFHTLGKDATKQSTGESTSDGIWTKSPDPIPPAPQSYFLSNQSKFEAFDMRGQSRVSSDGNSRNDNLSTESPSRHSSMTGSASVQPISSDSSPNIATPDSIQPFDPERFFGNMNMGSNGMDVNLTLGQGISDDGTVEFFTEMLGVQLNNNN